LAVVLVLVDIIIKILFGRESISATIIRSITYSVSMSIFIYLIGYYNGSISNRNLVHFYYKSL
ncbi:hypothetical protein PMY09_15875, partial [Clostridium tertium]|uniref:hypothetical protein n=1 Tax=Clostridium tertium TaxID=1559 RepID=UPI00232E0AFA